MLMMKYRFALPLQATPANTYVAALINDDNVVTSVGIGPLVHNEMR